MVNLVCQVQTSKAQDVSDSVDQNTPVKLTGSVVKTGDIIATCDDVFIGEITDIGIPSDPSEDGWTLSTGVGVEVSENLRGSVESQISVSLRTLSNPNVQESPPKYDSSYIFLVNKTTDASQDPYRVVKLLPATDDNIAMVRKLLAKPSQ